MIGTKSFLNGSGGDYDVSSAMFIDSWAQSQTNGNGKSYAATKTDPEKLRDNYGKSRKAAFKIDSRLLRAVLVLAVVIAVVYRNTLLSMYHTNTDQLQFVTDYIENTSKDVWEYISTSHITDYVENTCSDVWGYVTSAHFKSRTTPILYGIFMTIFSWIMVYLDSNIPGVNPPTPFSPTPKYRYQYRKQSTLQLSYLTAIASGIVVSVLMSYNS